MSIKLRPGSPEDAAECGRIAYEAFDAICTRHNFPPDFGSAEEAIGLMSMLLGHRGVYSVIAEVDGRVAGSNFLSIGSPIGGVGPITVDPAMQNHGLGGQLMRDVLDVAARQRRAGVRLLQAGFHNRSLCLYTKLGFRTREPVSIMQGPPLATRFAGHDVRSAEHADVEACNLLCRSVHGFDRDAELRYAVEQKSATVVEHLGRISGYATQVGFVGHAVAASNQDLMALIGAATAFGRPGFLVPTRNHAVFAWCLNRGLKLVYQMTLMSTGLYSEPAGAYLPSVLY